MDLGNHHLPPWAEQLTAYASVRLSPQYGSPLSDDQLQDRFKQLLPLPADSLIVVNDADRSTPTARVVAAMRRAGILPEPVYFIIATGTHPPPNPAVFPSLTGAGSEDKTLVHHSEDNASFVAVGKTPRGTVVSINKAIKEAPFVFTINSVEPHYFAGFTGGIKSIVPGLAGKATTVQNHSWATDPASGVMRTKGNPVFEDLWDAGTLVCDLGKIFTAQLVGKGTDIFSCEVGQLRPAFDQVAIQAKKVYGYQVGQPVNRIISFVEQPLDETLYQAQKAIENTKSALIDGGSFVMVARCAQGIGNSAFFKKIKSLGIPQLLMLPPSRVTYKLGDHKAYYWMDLVRRADLLYVGDLPDDQVKAAFMQKITPDRLLALVKQWHNAGDRILIDTAGGFSAVYK